MRTRTLVILTISFAAYLFLVLTTDYSLTGFWSDVLFAVGFSLFLLVIVFWNRASRPWLTLTLRATALACFLVVHGLLAINLSNPFVWDTFKLRSFYLQRVEGRLFSAYFKPMGAYSGGYGNFWITESPRFFPLVEKRVYWDRTVHHDFSSDTFDGQPVDNYEVVKEYVRDEVISKGK